ncbi:MAG TPA: winged helix DNA-binding protein [archaeon]|nr:winged helix DNA-binding protein [archaeon]
MKQKAATKHIVENLFLHPKPVKMLVSLNANNINYASQVAKVVDCTYSHTVKVLEMFRKLGLVQFEKRGRVKLIKLTDDGVTIAKDFDSVRKRFGKLDLAP